MSLAVLLDRWKLFFLFLHVAERGFDQSWADDLSMSIMNIYL